MAHAERKAWDALGRYKFLMFGYHAAQWVTLAHLVSPQPANPFRRLVAAAKSGDLGPLATAADWPAPGHRRR